ncbi:MAG: CPBP family intramembrane metalloprotease [Balneolaceae bacterium]|nr:CPBP family intramembrane metalloprotease [Balneolaceae bacterium]MCH8548848.1 CPBP family intramembrane metalloprotease [Balneolaceae bacterium]
MQNQPDSPEDIESLNLSGRDLLGMSLASMVIYLSIATLLFYFFHEQGLFAIFFEGDAWWQQLALGTGAGLGAALVIIYFSSRAPMKGVLNDFTIFRVISKSNFSSTDRLQISFFAGAGEEILFRGAIQPLIGIWLTSIIFVAIHGYFKFKSVGHILFGVLLFGLSMMLGYLFEYSGIYAAIAAHAVYDLVLLWWVQEKKSPEDFEVEGDGV